MEQTKNGGLPEYPLFRGLQRPLEFMGLQGRYIYWGAATVGGAILGFMLGYCLIGFVVGLVTLSAIMSIGVGTIVVKQKKGLHTKKADKGVFVYRSLRSI